MAVTSLMRVVRFRAAHAYRRSDWSEERNAETFGVQSESHTHDFRVVITISGRPDPDTGFLVDLPALDNLLEAVFGPLRKGDLNEVIPEVADGTMQPSTEMLAAWTWGRIEGRIPGSRATLEEVEVWESETLGSRVSRSRRTSD